MIGSQNEMFVYKDILVFIYEQLTTTQSPHTARREVDVTVNDAFYDVINQPTLATPTESDSLKPNEAYHAVMTCTANTCYSTVSHKEES